MISKQQYEVLCSFDKNGLLNYSDIKEEFYYPLNELRQNKFVVVTKTDGNYHIFWASQYRITEIGKAAIEEYERAIESLQTEKESVQIAREANDISRNANLKSDKANKIALGSFIVSIFSVIAAIVAIVISFI